MKEVLDLLEGRKNENVYRLKSSVRRNLNDKIARGGFDGNTSWPKLSTAIGELIQFLHDYSLDVAGSLHGSLFHGDKGHRTFELVYMQDKYGDVLLPVDNAMLVVSWYKHPNGRYEVLAYIS